MEKIDDIRQSLKTTIIDIALNTYSGGFMHVRGDREISIRLNPLTIKYYNYDDSETVYKLRETFENIRFSDHAIDIIADFLATGETEIINRFSDERRAPRVFHFDKIGRYKIGNN